MTQHVVSRRLALRRFALAVAGLTAGAGILGACAPAAPAPPATQPTSKPAPAPAATAAPQPTTAPKPAAKPALSLQKLRVAYNLPDGVPPIPDYMAHQYLQDRYGLEIEVQRFTGADQAIRVIIANQSDVSISTMAAGIVAVGQGQKIKAVIPAASAAYFSFVGRKDIPDVKSLAGKNVGMVVETDSAYWTATLVLQKYGVPSTAVNWVSIRGTPERAQALEAGRIDAGMLAIDYGVQMEQGGKFHTLAYPGKEFPNLLFSAYWASEEWMGQHADVLNAFAEAEMWAHREIQKKDAAVQWAAKNLPTLDPQVTATAHARLLEAQVWDPNEARWNAEAGDYTTKTLAELKAVERFVPFSEWATTQFAEEARKRLGAYKA